MVGTADITAVLDEDIPAVFERLGLKAKLERGTLKCAICSDRVTIDNLSLIFSDHGRPGLVCDKETCLLSFTFNH